VIGIILYSLIKHYFTSRTLKALRQDTETEGLRQNNPQAAGVAPENYHRNPRNLVVKVDESSDLGKALTEGVVYQLERHLSENARTLDGQ